MYSIAICTVFATLISFGFFYRESKKIRGCIVPALLCGLFGMIGGIVLAMVLGAIAPRHDVTYGPVELVSMRSVDGTAGAFVLGSGGLNTETTLHFYYRDIDGTMVPGNVPADGSVHISEDKNLKGVGYWDTIKREDNVSPAYAKWMVSMHGDDNIVRQEFRVPVGSVVHQFSAN